MPAKTKIKKSAKGGSASGGKIKAKPKAVKKPTAKKTIRPKAAKKHFHVSYLALAIVGLLVLEGLLFTLSSKAAWQEAVGILDMGPTVAETIDAMEYTFAPMIETVSAVNQFYSLATDAAMELLDLKGSEKELLLVINSVTGFYFQASVEMEHLLGISALTIHSPQVAGASVTSQ